MAALTITYDELRKEVGGYLGYTRDSSAWSVAEGAELDDIVKAGLRQFYWPPPSQGGEVVRWSFLSPQATISTSNATAAYTLPADFGGNATAFTYGAGANTAPLSLISEQHIRSLQAGNSQSGKPAYVAVRPKTSDGSLAQTWEAVLYPTPDAVYSILYRYDVTAQTLGNSNQYPLGGPAHAEAILESCLAVAEERRNDVSDLHRKRFVDRLAASVMYDASMVETSTRETWPVAAVPTTLDITYSDLMRHVGQSIGFGWNQSGWTRDQVAIADDLVQSGLRQFYKPPILESQKEPHHWSFLEINSSLSLVQNTSTYDLPVDYSTTIGDMTFAAGAAKVHIRQVTDGRIRDLYADSDGTGAPQFVSVRPKTSNGISRQSWQANFYPKPDTAYTVSFQYAGVPPRLTVANPFPWGGLDHAETILASCLAAAEERLNPSSDVHRKRFRDRLAASIQADIKKGQDDVTWPVADSAPTTLDIKYDDLAKRIGNLLGIGWDDAAWTTEERRKVDMLIQSGLRQFYKPPLLENQQSAHHWSFLEIETTLAVLSGSHTVDLPADFSGLVGDINYGAGINKVHISQISDGRIRDLYTDHDTTGAPQYVAIKPKISTGSARQLWQAYFYPKPDANYTLSYQYTVNPPTITSANPFPWGSQDHAETILASCLAVTEEFIGSPSDVYRKRFRDCLAASIQADAKDRKSDITWPVDDPGATTLDIRYHDLVKQIGNVMGIGWDDGAWSVEERRRVDMAIHSGLRSFYHPVPLPGERSIHEWSFLRPIETITTESGVNTYDLPSDFASIDGPMTFAPDVTVWPKPIEIVAEHQIRVKLSEVTDSRRPEIAAIRPKSASGSTWTHYELLLWPNPDAAYVLTYRYMVNIDALSSANQYPPGAQTHAETILESCLAAAERLLGEPGQHSARFMQLLIASVLADRAASSPEFLGYNGDRSDVPTVWPNARYPGDNIVTYNGVTY